jgi:hypothetical protein
MAASIVLQTPSAVGRFVCDASLPRCASAVGRSHHGVTGPLTSLLRMRVWLRRSLRRGRRKNDVRQNFRLRSNPGSRHDSLLGWLNRVLPCVMTCGPFGRSVLLVLLRLACDICSTSYLMFPFSCFDHPSRVATCFDSSPPVSIVCHLFQCPTSRLALPRAVLTDHHSFKTFTAHVDRLPPVSSACRLFRLLRTPQCPFQPLYHLLSPLQFVSSDYHLH